MLGERISIYFNNICLYRPNVDPYDTRLRGVRNGHLRRSSFDCFSKGTGAIDVLTDLFLGGGFK